MARLLWTQKRRIGPVPRLGHAMAFDDTRGRTVLFGGGDFQQHFFGDTWEWDGEHWTQLDDIGPTARWRHAMTYDSTRRQVVLFGGQGPEEEDGFFGDTWEWDSEAWTQIASGGLPSRHSHAIAYDARRGRTVLFGGSGNGGFLGDSWEWDGNEWVQVEDAGPAARADHAMAFDVSRGRIVLFGGRTASSVFGDTWEWDGTAWTQVSAIGAPPAAALAMAATATRILVLGGLPSSAAGAVASANTWEWDGRHWTIRQDVGPGRRWDHAMVYDTTRRRGVLFGGTTTPFGQPVAPLGDTWEQFERGAPVVAPPPPAPPPGPLPGPAPVLQSLTVPPNVDEGALFAIEARLAAVATLGMTFHVTISGGGMAPFDFDTPMAAGQSVLNLPMPFTLFPGTYTVAVRGTDESGLATAELTAPLAVATHATLTLAALELQPPAMASGQTFEMRATLSGAAGSHGLTIPTRIGLGDGVESLFRSITVPPNGTTASATVAGLNAPPGAVEIRGTLGGVERIATLDVTG